MGERNDGLVLAVLSPGGVKNPFRAILEGYADDVVKTLRSKWISTTLGVTANSDVMSKHMHVKLLDLGSEAYAECQYVILLHKVQLALYYLRKR